MRCPPPSNRGCGGCPPRGTRRPARPAAMALLAAMAEIEAGRYDCALVVGVELERNVPGDQAARNLGAAAWVGHEAEDATFVWPSMFEPLADEYDRRYGLDERHLRGHRRAQLPQREGQPERADPRLDATRPSSFGADDEANPVVEGRIRRTDCSQVTDGAARDRAGRTAHRRRVRRRRGPSRSTASPASSAGATAPSGCRSSRSSTGQRTTSTCCRTSGGPSPMPSPAPGSPDVERRRRHRDPRLLHAVGVRRHRPLRHHRARARAGRRSRTATLERDGRDRR